ncbi:hypothetical protein CAPTEDRAFT_216360 [Capitella teleta]|uniref:Endonuclease/exonuclease/phosphatase domain-containing protein n=1 Tax=Capitella teleta TaxID=283909 RepID=R7VHD8_CAPTE|nr:hypothetical protein CAPTEDRAFT_216360 [Capitella teleta]|eukprot:ELU18243.1 hypothetical protein CAPTEDRAFT_216360 [Capitella teleta]
MRTPNPECILISLKCLPNTMIATCYIPPSDSPYHSFAPIAEIQAEMAKNPQQKMIVIGDLNARFREQRGLTYRKGTRWISELDSCLVSPTVLPNIKKFEINQSTQIPSDHAPVSLTVTTKKTPDAVIPSLQTTLEQSRDLGTIQED